MEPTTISVFLDYKCNFACDHCSVGSSPETEFEMPPELLDRFFDQLEDVPTVEQLVFTGGEVTLHKDRLLDALQRADDRGYHTRIVTNGWWAHTMDSAREMLDELTDAGLNEINTSWDDYHTEYMDVEPIVNLTKATLESDIDQMAIAVIVGDTDPDWDESRLRQVLNEELDEPLADKAGITLLEDSAAPLGSGEQLNVSNVEARNRLDIGCSDVMSTPSFHPDGSVKVCCGHAQFYRPDLTVGNIEHEPLGEIFARGQNNIVYWLIHEVGPKKLLDMMDVEPDKNYTGICHACGDLLGEYREEFMEFVKENKQELAMKEVITGKKLSKDLDILSEHREEFVRRLDKMEEELDGETVTDEEIQMTLMKEESSD